MEELGGRSEEMVLADGLYHRNIHTRYRLSIYCCSICFVLLLQLRLFIIIDIAIKNNGNLSQNNIFLVWMLIYIYI